MLFGIRNFRAQNYENITMRQLGVTPNFTNIPLLITCAF